MTRYRFNGLTLHTSSRRIEGPDGTVHLPPKPFAILRLLLSRPQQVVTREQLLDRVWPERPASDEVLSRCVADLRKCLGDDAKSPRFIETLPKVGYRFVGQLEQRPPGYWRRGLIVATLVSLALSVSPFIVNSGREVAVNSAASAMLSGPIPVTTALGDEDTPDFSPDGRFIVYAARASGDENWDLQVQDLDTGTARTIVAGPDREYAPVYAPDGSRIAFLRYRGESCQVVIKSLQEMSERVVADCRTPLMAYLDWAPDGRHIAYSDAGPSGSEVLLRTVDVDTGAVEPLVSPESGAEGDHAFAPRYSPDGDVVAFIRGSLDRNDLWLVDVRTGRTRSITQLGGRLTGLAWDREGEALYFGTVLPQAGIWRIVPGHGPQLVISGTAYTPAFDPMHGRLIYDEIRLRTNLWSVALDAGEPVGQPIRRIASTRIDNQPAVSPDGARVAFVSDRSGNPELWIADAEGGDSRRLTYREGLAMDRPDWSPDGRLLVYSVLEADGWSGYLQPMNGSPPEPLALDRRSIRHPTWSADGSWIFYAGASGIRRISLLDWRDEAVIDAPGAIPLFEAGDALHFLEPGRSGISRWHPDGSRTSLLVEFDLEVPASISLAGEQVLFVASSPVDGERRLFTHDLGSGQHRPLFTILVFGGQAHLSAAADGSRLYFSQTAEVDSDLVVLEIPR